MTFWPDTRFDGISTDARIRRSGGLRHPAGAVPVTASPICAASPPCSAIAQGDLHGERRRARAVREYSSTSATVAPAWPYPVHWCSPTSARSSPAAIRVRKAIGASWCSSPKQLLEPLATDLCLDAPKFQAAWAPPSRMTLEGRWLVVEDRARFGRQRRGRRRARAHLFTRFQSFPLG